VYERVQAWTSVDEREALYIYMFTFSS